MQLQDEERKHIARELHDSAGQILAALSMSLTPLVQNGGNLNASERKAISESLGLKSASPPPSACISKGFEQLKLLSKSILFHAILGQEIGP